MESKQHKHGGKRPGAGRKRIGAKPKRKITISIDPDVLKQLKRISGSLTTSEAIEQAVKGFMAHLSKSLDLDAITSGLDDAGKFANDDNA